ncbi:MAG: phospho-sugar mutase [Patescibacteria group bacterium]
MDALAAVENFKKSKKISPEAYDSLKVWLTSEKFSDFKSEVEALIASQDFATIEDSFYKHIEIGTGGIRGPLGVGPNRINLQTIGEAAQGLSNFIQDFGSEAKDKGVVIGHEVRKMSRPFAELCCSVFAANGIKSFIFDGLRATPEISFAVRHLGAVAGVMLTASHNPRGDNGFKFYWSDGGQVVPPVDLKFMELIRNVEEIERLGFEEAVNSGMVAIIGEDIDKAYFGAILGLTLVRDRSTKVVFSPIHGAGSTNVLPILEKEGFDVTVVPEQAKPDENFPTAVGDLINPEYPEVMDIPIAFGRNLGADLVLNSDPDADRIGVAAKISKNSNNLQFLTGNEVGVAMCHFILSRLKESGGLKPEGLVIETYVTTSLIAKIAREFGVRAVDDLLVGFKFIGEIIEKLENKDDFIFAVEESLGYLRGTFVRDKDAAISALTLAELVGFLKDQGRTLIEYLDDIYRQYGYYKNILHMQEMRGKIGFLNRGAVMRGLRASQPGELGGQKVFKVIDRLPIGITDDKYITGMTGDQLTFILSADELVRVTIRPSGTEPKIKYYVQNWGEVGGKELTDVKRGVEKLALELENSILAETSKYIK